MRLFFFFFSHVFIYQSLLACTTFRLPRAGTPIIGKSHDWHQSHGALMVNKRHVAKKALAVKPGDRPAEWVSRFGSVTVNQQGREIPLAGMNEAGLVVEIMMGGSGDPAPDSRPTLNELQWIQYQLDNYSSVAEVIQNAPKIRVSRVFAQVHYLICDRGFQCGVVEFVGKQLVNLPSEAMVVPTLANHDYRTSVEYLQTHIGFGGDRPIPKTMHSLDRFVRASHFAKLFNPLVALDPVSYAFDKVLASVRDGDHTAWNIVYEAKPLLMHVRTRGHWTIRDVDGARFDFSCRTPVRVHDLETGEGNITSRFEDYTLAANQRLIELGLKDIEESLPPGTLESLAAYPESTQCSE